jgi:hypothetical protein
MNSLERCCPHPLERLLCHTYFSDSLAFDSAQDLGGLRLAGRAFSASYG